MTSRKKLLSGRLTQKTVDWIFNEFVSALKNKIKAVYRVKDLRDYKKPLWGLIYNEVVYLDNGASDKRLAKTLVHELLHYFLDTANEKLVRHIEDRLWRRFSQKQKSTFFSFIPDKPVLQIPPLH